MMTRFLTVLLALFLPLAPLHARISGAVSAADPRAAEAGQQILREGGSATDAAMAMMLALTVVEPQSSGIGGGGFFVRHDGKSGTIATIDGRETAPASASEALFLDATGKPLPFFSAFPGGKSVGIPGNMALMAKAHGKWGKLPWARLFDPAIKLAEQGYVVNAALAGRLQLVKDLWRTNTAAQAIYWRDGAPAREGTLITNPALAQFLRRLATEGPQAFYTGDNAQAIIAATGQAPTNAAMITPADLAGYQAKERPAVCGHYRVYKICGMGPPSSGATSVLQILAMLERFDLAGLGKDNPKSWHLIGEAMLLAYADRDTYLADADQMAVPISGLLDHDYLARRSALIDPDHARGHYEPGLPQGGTAMTTAPSSEVPATTHFVAVDGQGDIVSMTSTIEGPFGSQLVANGYFLNNELTDFTFAPEQDGKPVANRVQPGKRPLSSMAPTIVYDAKGKPIFAVGAAGGKTIIMQVAKALIAHLDWGLPARDAIGLGLVYFHGTTLVLEAGTQLPAMQGSLEAMGHAVMVAPLGLKANAAELTAQGWDGAADPRSPGIALRP